MPVPLSHTQGDRLLVTLVFRDEAGNPTADFTGDAFALDLRQYADGAAGGAAMRLTSDEGGGITYTTDTITIDVDAVTMEALPGGTYSRCDLVRYVGGDETQRYTLIPFALTVAPQGTLREGQASVQTTGGGAPSPGGARVLRVDLTTGLRVVTMPVAPLVEDAIAAGAAAAQAAATIGATVASAPRRVSVWSAAPESATTAPTASAGLAIARALVADDPDTPVVLAFPDDPEPALPSGVTAATLAAEGITLDVPAQGGGSEAYARALASGRYDVSDVGVDVSEAPVSLSPAATMADLDALPAPAWSELTGTPATFAPSAHTHPTSEVTGLDAALAGKAATAHTHAQSDVTGLVSALAGKAATAHTHAIADTTGLQAALDARVRHDAAQALTAAQRTQARANILASPLLPLDVLGGAVLALADTRLSAGYAGPLARLRDTATGAVSDRGRLTAAMAVATWYDQSGQARHVSQATTTAQPLVGAGGLGIVFDGTDDYLFATSAALWAAGACTVLLVCDVAAVAARRLVAEGSSSSANPYYVPVHTGGTYPATIVQGAASDSGASVISIVNANVTPAAFGAGLRLLAIVDTGASIQNRVSGANVGAANTYSRAGHTLTLNRLAIGTLLRTTAAGFAQGTIRAVVAYPWALSAGELSDIESALSTLYGL